MPVKVTLTEGGVHFEPSDEPLSESEKTAVFSTWCLAVDWAEAKRRNEKKK